MKLKGDALVLPFFIILLLFLTQPAEGIDSISWGRVERFHLYGYSMLRFIDNYGDYRTSSFNLSLLEGIVNVNLDSWFKHPYIFQYHIGLGGYDTLRFGDEPGNSFTGLYDLWFTLYPIGPYTFNSWVRRNISYITQKELPSVRQVDESYGASFLLNLKDYPRVGIRGDITRFFTDTEESTYQRDQRLTTTGVTVSKDYDSNLFSAVYEFRNQKDRITDAEYFEHYVNVYNNAWLSPKTLFSLYLTNINRENSIIGDGSTESNTFNTTGRLFYRPSHKTSHAFNYSTAISSGLDSRSTSNNFVYDFEYYLTRTLRTIDSFSIQRQFIDNGNEISTEWRNGANLGGQLIQPYTYAQLRCSYFASPALIDSTGEEPVKVMGNSASIGGSLSAIPLITLSSDFTYSSSRSSAFEYGNSEEKRIETRITNRYINRWRVEGVSIYDKKLNNSALAGINQTENFSNTIYLDRYYRRTTLGFAGGYSLSHERNIGDLKNWFIEARLSGRLTKRVNATVSVQYSESSGDNKPFESLWYEQADITYVNRLLDIALQFYGTQRIHQYNLNTFLITLRRNFNAYF